MAADIVNPHLTTDRTVNTWSPETMVESLVGPQMMAREKALAVYQFTRRCLFHYRYLTRSSGGGTMDLVNSIGYCLCTPTAGTQARLASMAGLNGCVLSTPGHGSVSVQWDGKWHWMDAFLGGCVWNRDRSDLASLEEIVAEPSLLTRENASPVCLFPCRDVLYADALRFEPDNLEYHRQCAPDDATWAAKATPGKRTPMVWDDESSLAIALRPGETYTRRWDHEPEMYFLFGTQDRFAPPHHFCGIECERRDVANWPYWEPYVKEIESFDPKTGRKQAVKTGRYWANGRLTWKPVITNRMLADFARVENATVAGAALSPADPAMPAALEWNVACPYPLQGGWLRVSANGELKAAIKTSKQKTYTPLDWRDGNGRQEALLRPHFASAVGARGYTLRLELSGRDARLADIELVTVFQHNMYALPQLMPGANRVTVTTAEPERLAGTCLTMEYAWLDRETGEQRVLQSRIEKSPSQFTVPVPGSLFPRMLHLTFRNEG